MHRTAARYFAVIAVFVVAMMSCSPLVLAEQSTPTQPPRLMISELQTGGTVSSVEDGKAEFVELYNPDASPLDVTDWRVEYLSASHNGAGPPTRTLAVLEGEVSPKSYVLLGYDGLIAGADVYFGAGSMAASGLLAKGGGHVRVVDNIGTTVDLVGWGTGAVIGNWWRAPEIPAGFTIKRILPDDSEYTTGLAFGAPTSLVTPTGGGLHIPESPAEPVCEGLTVTELLPNPPGADAGNEFIELYNGTDQPLSMKGCSLRLGDSDKQFMLPDEILNPRTYRAFSDLESGITLPNATAQTLWLISSGSEQGILYPSGLEDSEAWAYINDTWQVTLRPTPGTANILLDLPAPEESEPATASSLCPAGKERNPATNRCRNVGDAPEAPQTACKPGYVRNVATGRCKKAVIAAAFTLPCKAGQQRNPETNRCRSVLGASTETKPCPEGQERNPDTNRCRKTASNSSSLAAVQDVRTDSANLGARWWIAGVLAAGAGGYAIYEWRQDIWQTVTRLKQRIRGKSRGG